LSAGFASAKSLSGCAWGDRPSAIAKDASAESSKPLVCQSHLYQVGICFGFRVRHFEDHRMLPRPKYFVLSILMPFLAALLAGCAVPVTKQAADLRDDSISQALAIQSAANGATIHINNADQAVVTATSQPGNPASTQAGLATAHSELGSARVSLAPIATATDKIKSNAVAGYTLTANSEASLQKEKASWFSDRQKHLGLIALVIMVLLGLAAAAVEFFGATTGIKPIFQAAIAVVWPFIKNAGLAVYHVGTLGLAWVGREFGKNVSNKAAAAPTTAGSPKTPLPPLTPAPVSAGAMLIMPTTNASSGVTAIAA
jgi:hypothetical protein